ncbi:MAG: DUF3352 domain-containing protein [Oscillatoriophycideae cyanobacterium NC_groundwater_1537_Pr4_S-0.65um_50_18]|nr:DUF3352 domain-containing protein [Oscillatoriophycideae cyanobacterium NC_groundwater_1537_Pr4_S-0.65um_50_18]
MIKNLFKNQKTVLWIAVGSAIGLTVGGAIAWWSLQQPVIEGLPTGADVIPEDAAVTLSFSTNEGQWRQLRQFGTPETEAALNKNWTQLRDRLLTANGLDYARDIKPWIGSEMTVAFLAPAALRAAGQSAPQQIQPYAADPLKGDAPTVLVLPIANPAKAQEILARPQVSASQDWVDRDYKGVKIREVQGKTERAYAAAVVGDRYLVASADGKAIEQVIDTFKGKPSVARTPGYGQAFSQLQAEAPLLRAYVNVPVATVVATNNANQPIPPQGLALLQGNRGFATAMDLEPEGVRFQSLAWLPSDSKVRYSTSNKALRMPSLLPDSTLMMASGGNFKQTWQNYSQQMGDSTTGGVLSPGFLRQGFNNLTGLDFDRDLAGWMDGEFSLALISDPGTANPKAATPPTAGVLLLAQTGNRKAADEAWKKLDAVMGDRYKFRVSETQVGGKAAIAWVSPFSSLTVTRGWLEDDVAFLAIGADVGNAIVPAPAKPLATNPLFSSTASQTIESSSGHFFMASDRLARRDTTLPLPVLPAENQAYISAIRALQVTGAVQDAQTSRYDVHVLLRRVSSPPVTVPAPKVEATLEAAPSGTPAN